MQQMSRPISSVGTGHDNRLFMCMATLISYGLLNDLFSRKTKLQRKSYPKKEVTIDSNKTGSNSDLAIQVRPISDKFPQHLNKTDMACSSTKLRTLRKKFDIFLDFISKLRSCRALIKYFSRHLVILMDRMPCISERNNDYWIKTSKVLLEDLWEISTSVASQKVDPKSTPAILDFATSWESLQDENREDPSTNWPLMCNQDESVYDSYRGRQSEILLIELVEYRIERLIANPVPVDRVGSTVEDFLAKFEQSESLEVPENIPMKFVQAKSLDHLIGSLSKFVQEAVENSSESCPEMSRAALLKDLALNDVIGDIQDGSYSTESSIEYEPMNQNSVWKFGLPLPSIAADEHKLDYCEPTIRKHGRTISESSSKSLDSGYVNSEPSSPERPSQEISGRKKCSLCTTTVEEAAFFKQRRYGLLINCYHVFCYMCISKCFKSSEGTLMKTAVCPTCQVESEAVAASGIWMEGDDKVSFFKKFTDEMKRSTDIVAELSKLQNKAVKALF